MSNVQQKQKGKAKTAGIILPTDYVQDEYVALPVARETDKALIAQLRQKQKQKREEIVAINDSIADVVLRNYAEMEAVRMSKADRLSKVAEYLNKEFPSMEAADGMQAIIQIMGYEGGATTNNTYARLAILKMVDKKLLSPEIAETLLGFKLSRELSVGNKREYQSTLTSMMRTFNQYNYMISRWKQSLESAPSIRNKRSLVTDMVTGLLPADHFLAKFQSTVPELAFALKAADKMKSTDPNQSWQESIIVSKEEKHKYANKADFMVESWKVPDTPSDTDVPYKIGYKFVTYRVKASVTPIDKHVIQNLFESAVYSNISIEALPRLLTGLSKTARSNFYGTGDIISPMIRLCKCEDQRRKNLAELDKAQINKYCKSLLTGVNLLGADTNKTYNGLLNTLVRNYFVIFRGAAHNNMALTHEDEKSGLPKGTLKSYTKLLEESQVYDEYGYKKATPLSFSLPKMKSDAGFPFSGYKREDVWIEIVKKIDNLISLINYFTNEKKEITWLNKKLFSDFNELRFCAAKAKAEVFPLLGPMRQPSAEAYSHTEIEEFFRENQFIEKGRIIWVPPSTCAVYATTIAQIAYQGFESNYYSSIENDIIEWNELLTREKHIVSLSGLPYVHGMYDLVMRDITGMMPFSNTRKCKFYIYSDNVYISFRTTKTLRFHKGVVQFSSTVDKSNFYLDEEGFYVIPEGTYLFMSIDGAKMETSTDEEWTKVFLRQYSNVCGFSEAQYNFFKHCVQKSICGGYCVFNDMVFKQEFMGSGAWSTFLQNDIRSYSCVVAYMCKHGIVDEAGLGQHDFDVEDFIKVAQQFGVAYTTERVTIYSNGLPMSTGGRTIEIDFLGFSVKSVIGGNPFYFNFENSEVEYYPLQVPVLETGRLDKMFLFNKSVAVKQDGTPDAAVRNISKATSVVLLGGWLSDPLLKCAALTFIKNAQNFDEEALDEVEELFVNELTTELNMMLPKTAKNSMREMMVRLKEYDIPEGDMGLAIAAVSKILVDFTNQLWSYRDVLSQNAFFSTIEPGERLDDRKLPFVGDFSLLEPLATPEERFEEPLYIYQIFSDAVIRELKQYGAFKNFTLSQKDGKPYLQLDLTDQNQIRLQRILEDTGLQETSGIKNRLWHYVNILLLRNPALRDNFKVRGEGLSALNRQTKSGKRGAEKSAIRSGTDKKGDRDAVFTYNENAELRVPNLSGEGETVYTTSEFGEPVKVSKDMDVQQKKISLSFLVDANRKLRDHLFKYSELLKGRSEDDQSFYLSKLKQLYTNLRSSDKNYAFYKDGAGVHTLVLPESFNLVEILGQTGFKIDSAGKAQITVDDTTQKTAALFSKNLTLLTVRRIADTVLTRLLTRLGAETDAPLATEDWEVPIRDLRRYILCEMIADSFERGVPLGIHLTGRSSIVYGKQESLGLTRILKFYSDQSQLDQVEIKGGYLTTDRTRSMMETIEM